MSGLPRSSHALVTGGGRGIGREIASSLVQAGVTVTVLGRNRRALDDLVAAGVAHAAVIADVADQAAMNSALAEAALRQPIDILVANAGIAESAPFGKTDAAMFRRMLDVNFMGVVYAAQAVLRPSTVTVAPACTSAEAISRPMPRPPPVTSACEERDSPDMRRPPRVILSARETDIF